MLVQYLVGLCCTRHDPEAVRITLGDMVLDSAAGKKRDVDVTVTVDEPAGTSQVFMAYEVKREGAPLDVSVVEQLTIKLQDMPAVTHKAIVSTSGFTSGAVTKAASHGVELYELQSWSGNLEDDFPDYGLTGPASEVFMWGGSSNLYWKDWSTYLIAPGGPASFSSQSEDAVFTAAGAPHAIYRTVDELEQALLLRSTIELFPHEPAQTLLLAPPQAVEGGIRVSPKLPHSHTLDIASEEVFLMLEDRPVQLQKVVVSGSLQWESSVAEPEYYVMRNIAGGEIFAGAMVALGPEPGQMMGLVLSPDTETIGVHRVHLSPEQLNIIRELTIQGAD